MNQISGRNTKLEDITTPLYLWPRITFVRPSSFIRITLSSHGYGFHPKTICSTRNLAGKGRAESGE